MELVERYLQAVAFWLPEDQHQDIVAELREDICSEIEERESELDRPVSNTDVEALLKRRGSPTSVAQRYFPQRFLIGPMLFPIYTRVLKIALLGFAVPALVVWLCLLLFSPGDWAGHLWIEKLHPLGTLWTVLWSFFIVVTVIFALLERLQEKAGLLEQWNPKKLKPVRDLRQVPRSQSGTEFASALVFITWWRGWVHIREIPGLQLVYGPIWHALYWPVAAAVFASGILAAIQLIWPAWTRRRAAMRLVLDAAGVILASVLAAVHPWLTIVAPNLAPSAVAGIEASINGTLAVIFVLAIVTHGLRGIQDLRRLRGEQPLHNWAVVTLAGS